LPQKQVFNIVVLCFAGGLTFSPARAEDCHDLTNFGKHAVPPRVLAPPGPVSDTYAHFSYGSDLVISNEQYYSWTYIKNEDKKGLGAEWAKVNIKVPPPGIEGNGGSACKFNFVAFVDKGADTDRYVDSDASIVYSASSVRQEAPAYVRPRTEAPKAADGEPAKPARGLSR
jgi:hypothetical protein